jgi:hypothetical protein
MRLRFRPVPASEPPSNPDVLATVGLTAGTACFHYSFPEGSATTGIQVGSLNTQTDVKTTWPDGSIHECQISCIVVTPGDYELKEGPATSGSFTPVWPTASVAFVISGTTWTATLPSLNTGNPWMVGPHVKEYQVHVVPMNGATPHPILDVLFDVRSFAPGGHMVGITVENPKDDANNNSVSYAVTVVIAGSTVLTATKLQRTTTNWYREFVTGATLSAVTYDLEPFFKTYALERYEASIADTALPTSGTLADARYEILGFGDMSEGMASPGGRPELGPNADWWARFFVHQNPTTFAYAIRHADLTGSWSGNIKKADRTSIRRTEHSTYWLDAANRGGSMSIPGDPENFGFLQGWGEAYEINHLINTVVPAYQLTGSRHYLEQARSMAHAAILMQYLGDGWHTYGVDGITPMRMLMYTHQIRGIAWGLAAVARAASILPDGDPDKAYFTQAVTENLTHLNWVATTLDPGGPDAIPFVSGATGGSLKLAMVPWQCDYVDYAIDLCNKLRVGTGGQDMKLQLCNWRVELLTPSAGWDPRFGACYWVPNPPEEPGIGTQTAVGNTPSAGGGTPTIPAGVGRVYYTKAEIYTLNFVGDADTMPGPYTSEAKMACLIALRLGVPGAQAAIDLLVSEGVSPTHAGWQILGVGGSES